MEEEYLMHSFEIVIRCKPLDDWYCRSDCPTLCHQGFCAAFKKYLLLGADVDLYMRCPECTQTQAEIESEFTKECFQPGDGK